MNFTPRAKILYLYSKSQTLAILLVYLNLMQNQAKEFLLLSCSASRRHHYIYSLATRCGGGSCTTTEATQLD